MGAVRIFSDVLGTSCVEWRHGFETPGSEHRLKNQELIDAKPYWAAFYHLIALLVSHGRTGQDGGGLAPLV
jgi:hypothetical protein